MAVIIFGDSITNRATDLTGGGWTSRLWAHIYNNFHTEHAPGVISSDHSVHELGIGGDTIVGIARRFESELATRVDICEEGNYNNVVVGLAVGINDSRIVDETWECVVPFDIFSKTYEHVVERFKQLGSPFFLVGLNPVDESKMMPAPWTDPATSYINKYVSQYNDEIRRIALHNDIRFVDVHERFTSEISAHGYDSVLADGLHPNDHGHQLIADLVFESIHDLLG
jgi:lysophospholipase L1-like esterase